MTTTIPPAAPTDPGPFQKYLFSGACYVQLGECYRLLMRVRDDGPSAARDTELQARLATLWHDQAMRQSALAALAPAARLPMNAAGLPADIVAALRDAGEEVAESVIAQFDPDATDFSTFFGLWIEQCAIAWERMVRSEWFAAMFAQVANGWIRTTR